MDAFLKKHVPETRPDRIETDNPGFGGPANGNFACDHACYGHLPGDHAGTGSLFHSDHIQYQDCPVGCVAAPTMLEDANNNSPATPQRITLPCEVAGSFYPQRNVDWFSFEAEIDDVWSINLYAQRLGRSCDAAILIQRVSFDDKGEQQVANTLSLDDVQERNFNNRSGRHEFDERTTDR